MAEIPLRLSEGLNEIRSLTADVSSNIRDHSKEFHMIQTNQYETFLANMRFNYGSWRVTPDALSEFYHPIVVAQGVLLRSDLDSLGRKITSLGEFKKDWYLLGGFLLHDIVHLLPTNLLKPLIDCIDVYGVDEIKNIRIFDRQKRYLDEAVRRGEEIASNLKLPVEFIYDVVLLELGESVPTSKFSPASLLERIAFLIKGRYMADDYELLVNSEKEQNEGNNTIIVRGRDNLVIDTSEAMIFSVIYNLAKNAAKAISEKHYDEKDRSLEKAYTGGKLEHPRSLSLAVDESEDSVIMTVGDDGPGLSLDGSLTKIQQAIGRELQKYNGNVEESEFYKNLKRILGPQAEILIAWPNNPSALRNLTVGSIFDSQFVMAFRGENWNLRTFTSGMGLWGVRYLTERLGGTVIGTNKFEGGALFTVTLPKTSLGI